MQFQLGKRAGRPVKIAPEFTQLGDKILASSPWPTPGGRARDRFMVFTISAGKIVDMQGFVSRREAERFAKR